MDCEYDESYLRVLERWRETQTKTPECIVWRLCSHGVPHELLKPTVTIYVGVENKVEQSTRCACERLVFRHRRQLEMRNRVLDVFSGSLGT